MSHHVRLVRPTETTICSDDDELRHARSVNAILPGRCLFASAGGTRSTWEARSAGQPLVVEVDEQVVECWIGGLLKLRECLSHHQNRCKRQGHELSHLFPDVCVISVLVD
jgi:hypothetical protein